MIDITGSDLNGSDLYVRYVGFQTGYSYSSGGYNFSIKLTPYPANGKSCQIFFGDLGPNTWAYRDAPAFNEKNSYCRELQLTTNSQIGVSNGSNKSTIYVICPLFKFTLESKLYTPSTLNIDFIVWHTHLIVCAVK